jgi:hypothetical protein
MTGNDIKTICEKIDSLHTKILKSKFAETVTESEILSLTLAVRGLNDQKAEIERLTVLEEKENQHCKNVCEPRYKEEIKRLKLENALFTSERTLHEIGISELVLKHKAEAIKEFAERLKEKIRTMERLIIYDEDIDNLVKEMVGDI